MFTRRDMRRRVAIKIHWRMWMPERRWHVYRLLKKLLDSRAGSKSAGTYLRHFTEALCRAEITIAIVIIGCVMRTMRLGWTRKSHPIVCRASRFDRKRQSDWKNIHTSLRNADRKNMAGWRRASGETPRYVSDSTRVGSARRRAISVHEDPRSNFVKRSGIIAALSHSLSFSAFEVSPVS